MQIADLLRGATVELSSAGVPSPQNDAELLLAHVSGISRGDLIAKSFRGESVPDELLGEFAQVVAQRAARVPLQHITGSAEFFGMTLEVGKGVFVPRPETEYLLELVATHSTLGADRPRHELLDIGTGSGAIACGLQKVFPTAGVTAFELDPIAAGWARRNFKANAPEVQLFEGDFAALLANYSEHFDLVVSNPPYIPTTAVPVDPEVWLHDPDLALYSGSDGLDAIRQIAGLAPAAMRPGAQLWLEHAAGQSLAIVELLLAAGWSSVLTHQDLTGRSRYVSARLM